MSQQQVFDIFCSYDSQSAGKIVLDTSEKLISKNWDVIVDRYQKVYLNDSKADINRSKIFLCFFTTQYSNKLVCLQKLEYAKKINKRIIIILLEKVDLNNLANNFKIIVENSPKVIAYDAPNDLMVWFEYLFEQIRIEIEIIEQIINSNKAKVFRTTIDRQMKHDMFISFENDNSELIESICNEFSKKGFKLWVDLNNVYKKDENLHSEVEEAILESRMVICFITQKYITTNKCHLEIKFTNSNKKKYILVLLENFDIAQAGLGVYLLNSLKCNAYEEKNCLHFWSDNIFEKIYALIRKVYCQLYVKEDFNDIDENNELNNIYKKIRRIILDCAILREKSLKLRAECYKKSSLNERQDLAIDTFLKSFTTHNKSIQIQKKYVEIVLKKVEEKQKLIFEKYRVYKQEISRFSSSKSINFTDYKKRIKGELENLFERIKFLIREELLLMDELYANVDEHTKLVQIKSLNELVNTSSELRKLHNESDLLFISFQKTIEKQLALAEGMNSKLI